MLNEQTHQKLIEMKLCGMAALFQDFLNEKGRDKLSFEVVVQGGETSPS